MLTILFQCEAVFLIGLQVVGPLLYNTADSPYYRPGLIGDLCCWIVLAALTLITAAYLAFRNKQQAAIRVRLGKSEKVIDTSLEVYSGVEAANEKSFDDLTDWKNEDFIYVL